MSSASLDLARARVLIANDDGIAAPGLKVLERVARSLAKDVWVVSPESEQSAAGHSITVRRPLRIRALGRRRYAVDGTPTDAVLLAINEVMQDRRPDLMLSGINRGANLGDDVTYSGTVAAAMEATILGVPAIALSQAYEDKRSVQWATAEHWAPEVVSRLVGLSWPRDVFINVNFPDVSAERVSGIEVVRQGRRKIGDERLEGVDPRGVPYFWIGAQRVDARLRKGTDLEASSRGAITVTPLSIDLSHRPTMRALKGLFR